MVRRMVSLDFAGMRWALRGIEVDTGHGRSISIDIRRYLVQPLVN